MTYKEISMQVDDLMDSLKLEHQNSPDKWLCISVALRMQLEEKMWQLELREAGIIKCGNKK